MAWFTLALELGGMTVAELQHRMSSVEFAEWLAFAQVRAEAAAPTETPPTAPPPVGPDEALAQAALARLNARIAERRRGGR